MNCPDCQGNLLSVSVTGFDESFRCSLCGGFWLQGWVVTKAAEEEIDQWSRLGLKPDPTMITNKCPKDGTELVAGGSEVLPEAITAKKCIQCDWWWMSGDTLFDYRAAQAAKKSYLHWWGKPSDVLAAFLPALLLIIMAVGIAYGVGVVRKNTQLGVPARTPKVYFSTIYEGRGKMKINLSSLDKIEEVVVDNRKFQPVLINGVYQVIVDGLVEGGKYLLRVNDEVFEFVAK